MSDPCGFDNKLTVFLRWAYSYFTYKRGARLIVPSPSGTVGNSKSNP